MTAPTGSAKPEIGMVTVIPDELKKLARLVVRGFYNKEDILMIDMLVRHHCMREEDMANLLKFDKKLIRARIAGLKKDKLIQEKPRMETRSDDPTKVEKMNCYFINYKIFVNVVKYKLNHMLKKLEMSERDAASRSSFKCKNCMKTYTDLEVIELIDNYTTGDMKCNHCGSVVEEDESAGPQSDSRQALAKFNKQMEILFKFLQAVEHIKLDPSVLDPEPVEIADEKDGKIKVHAVSKGMPEGAVWSGEKKTEEGVLEVENKTLQLILEIRKRKKMYLKTFLYGLHNLPWKELKAYNHLGVRQVVLLLISWMTIPKMLSTKMTTMMTKLQNFYFSMKRKIRIRPKRPAVLLKGMKVTQNRQMTWKKLAESEIQLNQRTLTQCLATMMLRTVFQQ